MLSNTKEYQNEVGFVCLEEIVHEDHLLRKKGATEQALLTAVVQNNKRRLLCI
jgi:hypothetical protein